MKQNENSGNQSVTFQLDEEGYVWVNLRHEGGDIEGHRLGKMEPVGEAMADFLGQQDFGE